MAVFFVWIKMWASRRDRQLRRRFVEMPRPAGWSLLDRMDELMEAFNAYLMMTMVIGAVCWAIASFAGNAALLLTAGIAACSVFLFLSGKSLIRYSNCRLGLLGELVVGQILDRVSSDTIRVFHDLEVKDPGKKPWNIDHVVLTHAGVFAIETKARRKPRDTAPDAQQGHRITFDGQQLIFPAPMKADRHGLDQAQRNATWLALHQKLINQGVLVPKPGQSDLLSFAVDFAFSASSAAAAVIAGNNMAGPSTWKTSSDQTLGDYLASQSSLSALTTDL